MNRIKQFFITATTSLLLLASTVLPAAAAAPWNVTGNYEVTFMLTGSPTPYTHHATLSQSGSTVTGSGGYPATGGDTYHWNVTSGSQTGNSLNLTVVYDLGPGAVGTIMHMMGTIASNGTVGGTWDDNLSGGTRTGTWSITKGVSVPRIYTPANGATVTQISFVKVDWTDSVGSNPPFQYMYQAFSDAGYTTSVYVSGWLTTSEIPTPGTPPGDYYLKVKARNASLTESDWSNGAANPYHIKVVLNIVPVPAECNQNISYNVIQGTSGSDSIMGTEGPDLILAGDGSDYVDGKGGDDCIVGGGGSDVLIGGPGNDVLLGGDGSDALYGGTGNDKLYGGAGSDYLDGGTGNDLLDGGAGSDAANGGTGTDTCIAEAKSNCEL